MFSIVCILSAFLILLNIYYDCLVCFIMIAYVLIVCLCMVALSVACACSRGVFFFIFISVCVCICLVVCLCRVFCLCFGVYGSCGCLCLCGMCMLFLFENLEMMKNSISALNYNAVFYICYLINSMLYFVIVRLYSYCLFNFVGFY